MQLVIFFVAFALASAASLHGVRSSDEESLLDVFNAFRDLLPIDKINATLLDYYHNDKEVQKFVELLNSEEFAQAAEDMNPLAGKQQIMNYIQDNGVDSYWYVNYIHGLFGWPTVQRLNSTRRATRSAQGLVEEISAMIPTEKFSEVYNQKLNESAVFRGLIDIVKSPTANDTMIRTLESKAMQDAVSMLREFGVDIDALGTFLHDLWGWGYGD